MLETMDGSKRTFCNICMAACGLKVRVEGGRVAEIRGDADSPHNRGGLCPKGLHAGLTVHHPHRLTTPLVRSGGRLKPASWSAALERTAGGLTRLADRHGPQSLAIYRGTSSRFLSNAMAFALARLYGTPNITGTWSLCVGPKILGYRAVFGGPDFPITDFRRARLIVLFGTNPPATRMHRHHRLVGDIAAARRTGAKLVVVDPRRTAFARRADVHLAINPGTDVWLILALAALLIRDNAHDHAFVADHCSGFHDLAASLAGLDIDRAARATGLTRTAIEDLARDLAELRPAALDRREGLIHHANGTAANQALAALIALTGNVDIPGGLLRAGRPSLDASLGVADSATEPPLWRRRFPLAGDASGLITGAMAEGRIRGLLTIAGNPLTAWPDTGAAMAALKDLDFLVVNDLFPTETAQLADVVLPGASFLEKGDLEPGLLKPGTWLRTSAPVVDPPGEARAEWRCLVDLARVLGHSELDWITDADSIIGRILADSGLSHLDPAGLRRGLRLEPDRTGRWREKGFATPSGRIELKSSLLAGVGLEPLPRPSDPCPVGKRYPWRLITGHRRAAYYHSLGRNIPELRRMGGEAEIEVSPRLAAAAGLTDGLPARVTTPLGSLTMPLRVVAGMNPNTVALPHGWTGPLNANLLIGSDAVDPAAATPAYRSAACRIDPA